MTTKQNYVYQVFNQELSKYPPLCFQNIPVPSHEDFEIEYVPPQYDPTQVREDMPEFFHKIHQHIIKHHMKNYSKGRQKSLEQNLYNVLSTLDIKKLINMVSRYLCICGKTDELYEKWSFLNDEKYKSKLRRRMKTMREDLVIQIRKALNDLVFQDSGINKDMMIFMKILLNK